MACFAVMRLIIILIPEKEKNMGFWDALGKAAQSGMNKLNETNMEIRAKAEAFESKSDDELKSIMRSSWSSYADKAAAAKILKRRGY